MNPPEGDKKIIRDSIQCVWVERDLAALPSFWTADCLNHAAPAETRHGLAALHAYHAGFMDALAAFTGVEIEVVQQVAEGGRVVTQLLTRVQHSVAPFLGVPATGRSATLATIRIDRLEGDKIAAHWSIADMAGFMQ